MNWLLIGVVFVLILCALHGLYKGLVRMIFSLISIFIVLIFVSFATPYISNYLESNTPLYNTIQTKSESYIEKVSKQTVDTQVNGAVNQNNSSSNEKNDSKTDTTLGNGTVQISEMESKVEALKLPASIQKKIIDDTTNAASTILDESGLYKTMSESMAHIVVSGISFVIAFVAGMILIQILLGLIDIIMHLPVLHGVNTLLGAVAGAIEGFLLVWVFLYIVALCTSTAFGILMTGYIRQSMFLTYLYQNNGILQIVNHFIL